MDEGEQEGGEGGLGRMGREWGMPILGGSLGGRFVLGYGFMGFFVLFGRLRSCIDIFMASVENWVQ